PATTGTRCPGCSPRRLPPWTGTWTGSSGPRSGSSCPRSSRSPTAAARSSLRGCASAAPPARPEAHFLAALPCTGTRSSSALESGRAPAGDRGDESMKTKAAVLWGLNEKWQIEDVGLDPPKDSEVLVKLTASGLCHSDEHLVTGDIPMPFPVVGGHE